VTARTAQVRFYVDADIRGLGLVLGGLRNDVTYPADPGGFIHKRQRPACPIATTDVLDDLGPRLGFLECDVTGRSSRSVTTSR
jgi:hypothetical protein